MFAKNLSSLSLLFSMKRKILSLSLSVGLIFMCLVSPYLISRDRFSSSQVSEVSSSDSAESLALDFAELNVP